MLLRRVIEHVKAQNWTAVALDFLIVVVGVFIGIQVNNLNQTRQQRNEVAVTLEQIAAEAELLIDRYHANLRWLEEQTARNKVVLEVLDGDPLTAENREDFEQGLFQAVRFPTFTLEIQPLDNLVTSGRLSLIEDPEVRDVILRLVAQQHTATLIQERVLKLFDSAIVPVQRRIGHDMSSRESLEGVRYAFRVRYDLDQLRNDPEFRNAISNISITHYTALTGAPSGLEVLQDLVSAIRGSPEQEGENVVTPI